MMSKVARCRELQVAAPMTTLVLLEFILELYWIGYPLTLLRALVHALPPLPPCQAARKIVRTWLAMGRKSSAGATKWNRISTPP
eukprot:2926404-Lingulodinium_polyedra.AAC.1